MYFKNAISFPFRGEISLDALEEKLLTRRFAGCSSHDAESYGWTPAHDGRLVYPVGFIWMIALKVQRKLLPGAVVRQHVDKLAAKLEGEQGYKPGRAQRKELKEQALLELLPRAFVRDSVTYAYVDPNAKLLVVDAGTVSKAEDVVSMLIQCGVDIGLRKMHFGISPSAFMSSLLAGEGEAGDEWSTGKDCDLKEAGEGGELRYRHLNFEGIEEHLAAGKLPVKLAVTYEDRISFTLTEAGHLKRIKILDLATEAAQGADEAFDGEAAVNAAEITRAIQALRHALNDKDEKDENGQA